MNEGEAYFALKADFDFDPAVITQRLGVEPTRVMRKDDPRPKITSWILSSGEVVDGVVDVYAMSSQLVTRLAPLSERIKQLITELDLSAVFQVVLRITVDDTKSTPAIALTPKRSNF